MLELSDQKLTDLATKELNTVLDVTGEPIFARVSRYPQANPQYNVGHHEWLAEIDQLLPLRLFVTGSSYRGIGIPDCVNDATRIARAIINHLQGGSI